MSLTLTDHRLLSIMTAQMALLILTHLVSIVYGQCETNGRFESTAGYSYFISCKVDYPNYDLNGHVTMKSFDDCISSCDVWNTLPPKEQISELCIGVAYIASPGLCYLEWN